MLIVSRLAILSLLQVFYLIFKPFTRRLKIDKKLVGRGNSLDAMNV